MKLIPSFIAVALILLASAMISFSMPKDMVVIRHAEALLDAAFLVLMANAVWVVVGHLLETPKEKRGA